MQRVLGWVLVVGLASGCGGMANVTEEQNTLMRLDREWSAAATDPEKFTGFLAADANSYPPGMPLVSGGMVCGMVTAQGRADKITIIKFRRRKHYQRKHGHQQLYTEVEITSIAG